MQISQIIFAECLQFGNAFCCCKPYDFKINRAIFVGNIVPHTAYFMPRDFRVLGFEIFCQFADQFTNLQIHIEMAF